MTEPSKPARPVTLNGIVLDFLPPWNSALWNDLVWRSKRRLEYEKRMFDSEVETDG